MDECGTGLAGEAGVAGGSVSAGSKVTNTCVGSSEDAVLGLAVLVIETAGTPLQATARTKRRIRRVDLKQRIALDIRFNNMRT